MERRMSSDSRRSDSSSKKMKPERESSRVEQSIPITVSQYQNKKNEMLKSQPVKKATDTRLKLKESFHEIRQSSKILPDDFEEEEDPRTDRPTRFSRQIDPEAVAIRKSRSKEKLKAY